MADNCYYNDYGLACAQHQTPSPEDRSALPKELRMCAILLASAAARIEELEEIKTVYEVAMRKATARIEELESKLVAVSKAVRALNLPDTNWPTP